MKRIAALIMILFVLFLTLNLIKTEDNICISGNRDFILNLKVDKFGAISVPVSVELINVGGQEHVISSDCIVELVIHNQKEMWRNAECVNGRYNYTDSIYKENYVFGKNWTYLGSGTPLSGAYTANAIFSYVKDGSIKDLICSLNFNLG